MPFGPNSNGNRLRPTTIEFYATNCQEFDMNFSQVSSLTIGDNVEAIPAYFLRNNKILGELELPVSVHKIGTYAFYATGLTSIELSEEIDSIGENAFGYCRSLTTFAIPDSVKVLEAGVLYGSSALEELTIGEGLNEVHINISEGLTALKRVNYNAVRLNSLQLAQSEKIEAITIGPKVEVIPDYFAKNQRLLTSISFPDGLKTIGNEAFYCCNNITSIEIPHSVEYIGISAFLSTGIKTCRFPASEFVMGNGAFFGCISLQKIYSYVDNTIVYVPRRFLEAYQNSDEWNMFNILPLDDADVNMDGFITAVDITEIYNVLLGNTNYIHTYGDVDGDGTVTATDITIIYNILLGN